MDKMPSEPPDRPEPQSAGASHAAHTIIDDLKSHARVLHRYASAGDPIALTRLRRSPALKPLSDTELRAQTKRTHCLWVVARELGFNTWDHARALLTSQESQDFGTSLYPESCMGHWNIWSVDYAEASSIRATHGGYLLAYKRQFLVVEAGFIDSLGLDPDDADWERMGRNWPRPEDTHARERLYARLVRNALDNLKLPGS